MNEHTLRRRLVAAIRLAQDAQAKAEREMRPMTRDVERGKALAYKDVLTWIEEA